MLPINASYGPFRSRNYRESRKHLSFWLTLVEQKRK